MELEVINETSFEEHNETFFYTTLDDKKEEVTRREFLKYLTIGSAGLLVPIGLSKEADASPLILIALAFGAINLIYEATKEDKPRVVVNNPVIIIGKDVHCDMQLVNGGHHTVKGAVSCENKHRKGGKLAYKTVEKKTKLASVKAGYTKTLRADLTKSSSEEGDYLFEAKSKKDKISIKYKRSHA